MSPVTANTRVATPAVPATPKAVKPADRAKTPPPISVTATPNNVIDPANANIAGVTGANSIAAPPITANVPARVIKPVAISCQVIPPSTVNTGVNIANAPAITNKAAAPPKAPCTNCSATVMIVKAPLHCNETLSYFSPGHFPMFSIAFANINIAAPSIVNPTAVDNLSHVACHIHKYT